MFSRATSVGALIGLYGQGHFALLEEEYFNKKAYVDQHRDLVRHVFMFSLVEQASLNWIDVPGEGEMICESHIRPLWDELVNSLMSEEQWFAYCRGVSLQWLDADFEYVSKRDVRFVEAPQMQTFCQKLATFTKYLPRAVINVATMGMTSIWSKVCQTVGALFRKALGSHYEWLEARCSWIKGFWAGCEAKLEMMYSKSMGCLTGLEDCFAWAAVVVSAVALIYFVERFLIATNIVSGPVGLVNLFVPAVLALTGVATAMHYGSEKVASLVTQLNAFVVDFVVGIPQSFVPELVREEARAQWGPVEILENFSRALSNLDMATVVQGGRTAAALNSVMTASSNLYGAAQKGVFFLLQVLETVLGTEGTELGDLSIYFGMDLQQWVEEVVQLESAFLYTATAGRHFLQRACVLAARGAHIRQVVLGQGKRVGADITNLLMKTAERIQKLKDAMTLQGSGGLRQMPFVLACIGTSRVGKSLLVRKLVGELAEMEGYSDEDIYARNPLDPFWSKYRRQFAVIYDDFAAVKHEPSDESELIKLVSSTPFPLPMASLEEKGLFFDSPLIAYSSNFVDASPHSEVHDKAAFRNRRHFLVRVSIKPGQVYQPRNFVANQQYTLLSLVEGIETVIATYEDYEDLLAAVQTKWREHVAEQQANLSAIAERPMTFTTLRTLYQLILAEHRDLATVLQLEKDESVQLIWEGKAYIASGDEYRTCDIGEKWNTPGLHFLGATFEQMKCVPHINGFALLHMERLLKELRIDSNDMPEVGLWEQDPMLLEFACSLTKLERRVIFLVGQNFLNEKRTRLRAVLDSVRTSLARAVIAAKGGWSPLVKMAVGISMLVLCGGAMWVVLRTLAGVCSGAGFTGFTMGSVGVLSTAQSREPNRNGEADYKFRNVPLRARRNSKFQYELGELGSGAALVARNLYTLKIGEYETMVTILPGKRMVVVNHLIRKFPVKIRCRVVSATGVEYFCTFDPKRLELEDGSELAHVVMDQLPNVRKSVLNDFLWDREMVPSAGAMSALFTYKRHNSTGEYLFDYQTGVAKPVSERFQIGCGSYVRVLHKYYDYPIPTEVFDCGGLLVMRVQQKCVIVGMHIAGTGTRGQACPWPIGLRSRMEAAAEEETVFTSTAQCAVEEYFDFYDAPESFGPQLQAVATVERKKCYIRMPKKTSLAPVPVEWQLWKGESKEPSILVSSDERVPEEKRPFDLFATGMSKYKCSAKQLDCDDLAVVTQEIIGTWEDENPCSFDAVDDTTMLNGLAGCEFFDSIVVGTSEGFPLILERKNQEKGKARYLTGEPGAWTLPDGPVKMAIGDLERRLAERKHGVLVGVECPKDELLPLRKIYHEPKTRLFTILPMHYNLLMRKYFLRAVKWIMGKRAVLPCQTGINPYSREWNDLACRLQGVGNDILCCDYSSFDGLCSPQLMEAMADILTEFTVSERDKVIQRGLLMMVFGRYAICQNSVFQVSGGIPSGIALTVILNSLMNEILVRYCYRKIMLAAQEPLLAVQFHRFCALAVYGDDNLISVSPCITQVFNGASLQAEMLKIGVKITDGVDKTLPTLAFRTLEQCDFLKRGFKVDDSGLWTGPLEKLSLWSQLQYYRPQSYDSEVDAFLQNAESVYRELFLHGKAAAMNFRSEFHTLNLGTLPTYQEMEQFYDMQRGNAAVNFNLSSDLFSNTTMLGPLSASDDKEGLLCQIIPRVCAAARSQLEPGDFVVAIGTTVPKGLEGIVLKCPFGIGRGQLPTGEFLNSNFARPTSEVRKKIHNAYKAGSRIVFVATNGNLVPTIAALLWAKACKIVCTGTTAYGLQRLMEVSPACQLYPEVERFLV
ncbi:TPA_asm: polyprotein [Paris polyphylla secovirus 2]|nr:TPA_asm: polyprotein [Paris polyphylla secovirus 2]